MAQYERALDRRADGRRRGQRRRARGGRLLPWLFRARVRNERTVTKRLTRGGPLQRWSWSRIAKECRPAYRAYHRELRERHIAWSTAAPGRTAPGLRPFVAPTL